MSWVMTMSSFSGCYCKRASTTTILSTRYVAPGSALGCGCSMLAAAQEMSRLWPLDWLGQPEPSWALMPPPKASSSPAHVWLIGTFRGSASNRPPSPTSFSTKPVDAVIGRLILMHLADPVSALRQLAGLVRPGGLIAFCEPDLGAVRSVPETPQFQIGVGRHRERVSSSGPQPAIRHHAAQSCFSARVFQPRS